MSNKITVDSEANAVEFYNNRIETPLEIAELIANQPSVSLIDKKLHDSKVDGSPERIYFKDGYFEVEDDTLLFKAGKKYSPFSLLQKFTFKDNHLATYYYVMYRLMNKDVPYLRIGVNYFKKSKQTDAFGVDRDVLLRWSKQEIVDDHTKYFLKHIPRFDGFTLKPDNINYQPVIGELYNTYAPFTHKPSKGEWKWTERLLKHVFGEQYDLGIKYMQALYIYPTQALPILVLSSKTRMTGKSTFVNWINQIFGNNSTVVSPQDIESAFNGSYSSSNIVSIEETSSDKKHLVEKLKDLSTKKKLNVNKKYIDQYDVPFYAKFLITTNDTDKFLIVDSDEVRFWVRELGIPEFHNANIEEELLKEIPAFLFYLEGLPELDRSKSRMVFTPEEIRTRQLEVVQENSRSWLYKEMIEEFSEFFSHYGGVNEIFVTPKDIKDRWYSHNSRVEINYIRKVLKNEFNLLTSDLMKYYPFEIKSGVDGSSTGRPYCIKREKIEHLTSKLQL